MTRSPDSSALLTSSGRTGSYLRVLREGEVGAGDDNYGIISPR